MTLSKLYDMGLINDETEIWVRRSDFLVFAHGNWFQDNILEYMEREMESFSWQDDNKIYIDLKEGDEE